MKKLSMLIGVLLACFSLVACSPTGGDSGTDKPDVPADSGQSGSGNTGSTGGANSTGNTGDADNTGNIADEIVDVGNVGGEVEANPTITFSTGIGAFTNGTTTLSVHTSEDDTVTLNDSPRADGYAFVGWYNGSQEYSSSAKYTTSQTFTAKYRSGADSIVYEALFDESSTVSIKINMSDAEWTKLSNDNMNMKSPIYRMADAVTIGIDDGDGMLYYYYEEVGVRMKGNTSRHSFYNNGFYSTIHMKLSFKQTFDDIEDGYTQDELKDWAGNTAARKARKNRTFGGMEKIDIKYNSTEDETYSREAYAMKLFRDNGILAPRLTLCSVTALDRDTTYINLGVYRIHEAVDDVFIERNLGASENGDLWKCTWGSNVGASLTDSYDLERYVGIENELAGVSYTYDKKTNKSATTSTGALDFSSVINFIKAINQYDADYSAVLDTDYFAKFEAVNYILGNPDCIRNNYNNYYIYFRKSDGKAIIIPYDYDRCLGITSQWNPTGSASMYVTPYTRTMAATGGSQQNPLYVNLIDKGAPYGDGSVLMKYRADLIAIASSEQVTSTAFERYENNFKSKYSQYTATAIEANNKAFDSNSDNVSYLRYISTKLETLFDNIDDYTA